jgi:hypothetical protein
LRSLSIQASRSTWTMTTAGSTARRRLAWRQPRGRRCGPAATGVGVQVSAAPLHPLAHAHRDEWRWGGRVRGGDGRAACSLRAGVWSPKRQARVHARRKVFCF